MAHANLSKPEVRPFRFMSTLAGHQLIHDVRPSFTRRVVWLIYYMYHDSTNCSRRMLGSGSTGML